MGLKEQVSKNVWSAKKELQTPWLVRRDMIGDFSLF